MFDGLKFKPKNEDDEKSKKGTKRAIIIMAAIILISAVYTVVQYFTGDDTEKAELLDFLKNNFYINPIDITIVVILLVIMFIKRLKERNNRDE